MRHVPCIENVQGDMRPCLRLCMSHSLVMVMYNRKNSGFVCMLVTVTQHPKLMQCTFRRRERRMRPRTRLAFIDGTGFIDFCEKFKYLGSILHYSLTSDADVDKRIASATGVGRFWRPKEHLY